MSDPSCVVRWLTSQCRNKKDEGGRKEGGGSKEEGRREQVGRSKEGGPRSEIVEEVTGREERKERNTYDSSPSAFILYLVVNREETTE